MTELERIRTAFERVVNAPVETIPRTDWQSSLRPGGEATLLPKPLGPYRGILVSPDFEYAVASATPSESGIHHVRSGKSDPPEGRINIDSYVVVEDLTTDSRWPVVLEFARIEPTRELLATIRDHVFAYLRQRRDHWSPTVPEDIARARPKDGGR